MWVGLFKIYAFKLFAEWTMSQMAAGRKCRRMSENKHKYIMGKCEDVRTAASLDDCGVGKGLTKEIVSGRSVYRKSCKLMLVYLGKLFKDHFVFSLFKGWKKDCRRRICK